LRTLARVLLSQGQSRGLLAFGAADDHIHAVLRADRASAGAFALYVETALSWQLGLGVRFGPARIRPLHDQRHAYNTFHYVHRQDVRHDLHLDLAREGTSLPDLLGLRVLDTTLAARVREHLPRVRRGDLVTHFPAAEAALEAMEVGAPVALDDVVDAAAAAFALPHLGGRSRDASQARRAAVHAAGPDVTTHQLRELLPISRRAIQSLRTGALDAPLIRAVRGQAALKLPARAPRTHDPDE